MIDGVFSWLLLSDNKYDWATTPEKSTCAFPPFCICIRYLVVRAHIAALE